MDLKKRVESFCKNLPVEGTANSMKRKTRVFRQIDVQEFHLRGKHEFWLKVTMASWVSGNEGVLSLYFRVH